MLSIFIDTSNNTLIRVQFNENTGFGTITKIGINEESNGISGSVCYLRDLRDLKDNWTLIYDSNTKFDATNHVLFDFVKLTNVFNVQLRSIPAETAHNPITCDNLRDEIHRYEWADPNVVWCIVTKLFNIMRVNNEDNSEESRSISELSCV